MSSRNRYLSAEERRQALVLSRAVRRVESAYQAGESGAQRLVALAEAEFAAEPGVRVDYIELVDWATLLPVEKAATGSLFAVAAWVGRTRLIDNCVY
jgi:pantoate--beta-alanine ligase